MISSYMSWSDGVDLVALSAPGLPMPNVIVHFARMVHTPVGSAPAGMIFIPDPVNPAQPRVFGFVSPDPDVGAYFGPKIFAGTPFEKAPVLIGSIDVMLSLAQKRASVRIAVAGFVIESVLSGVGDLQSADRPAGNLPFGEHALEAKASAAHVTVNGQPLTLIIPPTGMSGGPPAVYSATGFYVR